MQKKNSYKYRELNSNITVKYTSFVLQEKKIKAYYKLDINRPVF